MKYKWTIDKEFNFEEERSDFLHEIQRKLNLDSEEQQEFKKAITKKYIEYAFSNEFKSYWEEEKLREIHRD